MIRTVTFDCYGTLIDWDTGVLQAIADACPESRQFNDQTALKSFDRAEFLSTSKPYRPYREVLAEVALALAPEFDVTQTRLSTALQLSVSGWPAFEATVPTLSHIRSRFPAMLVGILSNTDEDLLAGTIDRQFDSFHPDFAVTAESVRSYKPGLAHFERMLSIADCEPAEVLHVAASIRHDMVPGRSVGLQTCWVRRGLLGADVPMSGGADFEIETLAELPALLRDISDGKSPTI